MGLYKESRVPKAKRLECKWPVAIDKETDRDLHILSIIVKMNRSQTIRLGIDRIIADYRDKIDEYLMNHPNYV